MSLAEISAAEAATACAVAAPAVIGRLILTAGKPYSDIPIPMVPYTPVRTDFITESLHAKTYFPRPTVCLA
eukprot:scaffold199290_cov17-Prasinocladus_malaysianus.AAC.1